MPKDKKDQNPKPPAKPPKKIKGRQPQNPKPLSSEPPKYETENKSQDPR